MGVASCSSSVCHGNVKSSSNYNVQLNEYVTWSHDDTHSKAYTILLNERSRAIAAKLGLASAQTAKICLDCHSDNVPEAMRGREFNLTDGVGCETCHGGAEKWLESHTSKQATYADNLKRGMFPTANAGPRATLCVSCHVGNADKFATHRIMGAGHPRLSFELDTFLALMPPHHQVDEDYAARKPAYSRTAVWALGQVESARMQVQLVQQHFARNSIFPELALFNCHSCHESSMHRLDWARGLTTIGNPPGSVPLNDGHLRMAMVIARQTDAAAARDLLSLNQSLQEASGESRERVGQISGRLEAALRQLEGTLAQRKWSAAEQGNLLAGPARPRCAPRVPRLHQRRAGGDGHRAHHDRPRQRARHRQRLDALYRLVDDDETYRSDQFTAGIEQLRGVLGLSAPSTASK